MSGPKESWFVYDLAGSSTALTAANKQAGDIICICSGNRFPGQWVNLRGTRAAPHTCECAGEVAHRRGRYAGDDKACHSYETITPAAMKSAAKVKETNPTWKWTTEDPFRDEK